MVSKMSDVLQHFVFLQDYFLNECHSRGVKTQLGRPVQLSNVWLRWKKSVTIDKSDFLVLQLKRNEIPDFNFNVYIHKYVFIK